jgi:rubrerythrin
LDEITDVIEAIKTAIQMEKEGYAFYKRAAAQISSEMAKTMFESIANDERTHLDVFQKLFDDNVGNDEWDALVMSSKKYDTIPLFPKDLKEMNDVNPDPNELDALRIAMDNEQSAIDHYTKIIDASSSPDVKQIIEKIIEQEKNHYLILQGEFTHLSSTGYWYELDYLGG